MTPTGSRFQIKLDNELRRMDNEWFFRWHHIGRDVPIQIDSFDGRMISYGGLAFAGSPRTVYWSTIQRYIRDKVSTLFDELEAELKEYPPEIRRKAVEEVHDLILSFAKGRLYWLHGQVIGFTC